MKNTKNKGTIAEQLTQAGVAKSTTLPRHPGIWKEDGVDHINVSQGAKTVIGKWLNGRNGIAFHHPVLGQFSTIENLMFFVKAQSPDDRIRTEYDFNVIRRMLSEGGGVRRNMPYADAIHIEAIYLRILMNESLIKKVVNSDLPFDSYFVSRDTGLRQRFEPARYLVPGYEEIRKALKERRELNLRPFAGVSNKTDMSTVDIYKDVMERLTSEYKGNAREVIAAFVEQRWKAYDRWVRPTNAEVTQSAAASEVKKEKKASEDQSNQDWNDLSGKPKLLDSGKAVAEKQGKRRNGRFVTFPSLAGLAEGADFFDDINEVQYHARVMDGELQWVADSYVKASEVVVTADSMIEEAVARQHEPLSQQPIPLVRVTPCSRDVSAVPVTQKAEDEDQSATVDIEVVIQHCDNGDVQAEEVIAEADRVLESKLEVLIKDFEDPVTNDAETSTRPDVEQERKHEVADDNFVQVYEVPLEEVKAVEEPVSSLAEEVSAANEGIEELSDQTKSAGEQKAIPLSETGFFR
jgi:hypothetical protein